MGPLPSSGQISLSQIMTEMGRAPGTLTNVSQDLMPQICLTGGTTCSLGATFYGTSRVVLPVAPSWYTWAQSTTGITVYWYAVNQATNYYVSGPSSGYTGGGTSWTSTGLSPGTSYTFTVYAINCQGNGPSNSISIGTQPNPVTSLSLSSSTATSLTLSWSAPSGASQYYITYGPYGYYTSSTSYTISGLAGATTYTIQIASISAAGIWSGYYSQNFTTAGLYQFQNVQFNNVNTGRTGQPLSAAKAWTSGTPAPSDWYNSYMDMPGVQGVVRWTVPFSGSYSFTIGGARGAPAGSSAAGWGNTVSGSISLSQGAYVYILCGGNGETVTPYYGGIPVNYGGGGLSAAFIGSISLSSSYLIAGGGGGADVFGNGGTNGSTTENGTAGANGCSGYNGGAGGASGGGGNGGQSAGGATYNGNSGTNTGTGGSAGTVAYGAGAGGNGGAGLGGGVSASTTFLGGGNGGVGAPWQGAEGGFGGGGATGLNNSNGNGGGSGGGGGYSGGGGGVGGGGSSCNTAGGGGGSKANGFSSVNLNGGVSRYGFVSISLIS